MTLGEKIELEKRYYFEKGYKERCAKNNIEFSEEECEKAYKESEEKSKLYFGTLRKLCELINEGKLTKEDVLKVFDYSEKEIDVYTKVVKSDLDIFKE